MFRRDDPEPAPWTDEGKARIEKFGLWKISEKTADKEKAEKKEGEEGEENEGEEEKPKKKRGRKRKNDEISDSEEEKEAETKPTKAKKAKIDKTDSPTKNGSTLDNFFKPSPDKTKTKKQTPEKQKEAANGNKKASDAPAEVSKVPASYFDSDDEDDEMSKDIRKRIRDDPNQVYWREIFDKYVLNRIYINRSNHIFQS